MVSSTVKKQAVVLVSVLCTCVIIFTMLNVKAENVQKQIRTMFLSEYLQGTRNTPNYCEIYDLKAKNSHNFHCITMKTVPPAPICLHDVDKDRAVSKSLAKSGTWELHDVRELYGILKRDPNMGLIDIGGNIGVFSLFAAQAGHNVVTVEPFIDNLIRLHKAAQLGNTTNKITLLRNAVADVHTRATIIRSSINQGDTQILLDSGKNCEGDCSDMVSTIFLDDLLEVISFKTAVMKIDCQGYEHYAFRNAEKLLNQVDIKIIMMEWVWMQKFYKSDIKKDRVLVEGMIQLLKRNGFTPHRPKNKGGGDLSGIHWRSWGYNVFWHHNTL